VDEETKHRIAKNETLFRDVNERVKEIDQAHALPRDDVWEFLCECGNADCTQPVALTLAEYERARSSPVQFVLLPGHERPEVETLIEATDRFVVVVKNIGEQDVALARDPRS
jgi:hypothetical protein